MMRSVVVLVVAARSLVGRNMEKSWGVQAGTLGFYVHVHDSKELKRRFPNRRARIISDDL
jgi:NAD kinase